MSYFSGAAKAKGKVITFLDAHCEATEGWLEPLMAEIHKDRLVRSSFQQLKYTALSKVGDAKDSPYGWWFWGKKYM